MKLALVIERAIVIKFRSLCDKVSEFGDKNAVADVINNDVHPSM